MQLTRLALTALVVVLFFGGVSRAAEAQAPRPREKVVATGPSAPVRSDANKDRMVGRVILGGAGVMALKGLAIPAAVGSVGMRMLNGDSFSQALNHSAADAKRLVARATPMVKSLDATLSPVVGHAARQGTASVVRTMGPVLREARTGPGTPGAPPRSAPR